MKMEQHAISGRAKASREAGSSRPASRVRKAPSLVCTIDAPAAAGGDLPVIDPTGREVGRSLHRVCVMDAGIGVLLRLFRTLDEIADWINSISAARLGAVYGMHCRAFRRCAKKKWARRVEAMKKGARNFGLHRLAYFRASSLARPAFVAARD